MYQGQNTSPVLPWYVGGTGAHWMSPNQYTGLVTSTGRGGADIEQMYRSQQVGRGAPGSAAEMTRATTMGFSNWQQQQQGGGGFNPGGAPQGPFNAGGGGGGGSSRALWILWLWDSFFCGTSSTNGFSRHIRSLAKLLCQCSWFPKCSSAGARYRHGSESFEL